MPYIGRSIDGFGVRNRFVYLASSGDTSVSGADANGATLTFTDGTYVDVYLNGVLLKPTTDYNTSTANTIAGLSTLNTNDEVTVVVYDVFTVADMVSATSGGTFSGAITFGSTVSGLDVNGTEIILDADADTSITADTDDTIDIKIGGSDIFQMTASKLDINGKELILDADGDTSITSDTDDEIDFKTAGTDRFLIDSSGFLRQRFTSDNSTTAEGFFINNMQNSTGNNASLIFSNDSGGRKKAAIAHIDTGNYGTGDFVFALDGADSGSVHLTNDEKMRIASDGDITSTGSRFKLGAAGSRTVISPGTGVTVTLADDATFSVAGYSGSSSTMLLIYDAGGGGAMFFHTYQNTVQKITGSSDYVTSETDGNTCVHKASNNHAVSLTNKEGSSVNYYIMMVAAYD